MFGRSATLVGGGVGAVVVILVLLALVVFGHCSLPFQPAGLRSAVSPTPSVSSTVAPTSSPAGSGASPTPVTSESPSPSPSATASASASPSPGGPLIIAAFSLHAGEVGLSYAPVGLVAKGGQPPYAWSVGSGALPGGVTLGQDGTVAGTPSGAGTYSFVVQVADAGGAKAGAPASITVVPALGLTALCARLCYIEAGCQGYCGTYGQQSGGLPPYSYRLTGVLPTGTSLSALTLGGLFSPPVVAGPSPTYSFTVTVTDALGAAHSIGSNYATVSHVSTPKTASASFSYGQSGTFPVTFSGGLAPYSASLVGAPPQASIQSIDTTKDVVVIYWAGTTAINGATYTFTLVLRDGLPCSIGGNCSTQTAITLTQVGG